MLFRSPLLGQGSLLLIHGPCSPLILGPLSPTAAGPEPFRPTDKAPFHPTTHRQRKREGRRDAKEKQSWDSGKAEGMGRGGVKRTRGCYTTDKEKKERGATGGEYWKGVRD